MCKAPKVDPTPTPAASPPPAQPAASAADLQTSQQARDENTGDGANLKAKKKGRNALRIDLQAGSAGTGGTGLNVPQA